MGYFNKKQSMEMAALKHTKNMEDNYSAEIGYSVSKSEIFRDGRKFEESLETVERVDKFSTTSKVLNMDTVTAIFSEPVQEDIAAGKKVAVLNFASFKNPGGKFLEGSSAQEECLCHSSYLYNILEQFNREYYIPNQRNTHQCLYNNSALYCGEVRFWNNHPMEEIDENTSTTIVDVITCAAPNKKAYYKYHDGMANINRDALRSRIKFIKDICDKQEVEILIAGAFGCGVFGQDPRMVADYFNFYFSESDTKLEKVYYAVPASLNRSNWFVFREKIGLYGEDDSAPTLSLSF